MLSRTVLERTTWNGRVYLLMTANCGRPNCSGCPHGPYWYAIVRRRCGKLLTKYYGKVPPWERAAIARQRFLEQCDSAKVIDIMELSPCEE